MLVVSSHTVKDNAMNTRYSICIVLVVSGNWNRSENEVVGKMEMGIVFLY